MSIDDATSVQIAALQWNAHQQHVSEGKERMTWCRVCRLLDQPKEQL